MEQGDSPARIGRRQFLTAVSLAGPGLILVACAPAAVAPSPTAVTKGAPAAATPVAKPKVSASIKFAGTAGGVGVHMLPLFVAQELFLKEEGITQEVTIFSGGGDTVRGIVTGGHQMGAVSTTAAVIAAAEGQPIILIAENLPFATVLWYVKADSPLKSMKDLKGKKLGYSRPGSNSHTYALSALRSLGLEPEKDVQLVSSGGVPETLAAVKGGVIDVGWGIDPLATQEVLKKEIRILGAAHEFLPKWSEGGVATTVDYAKASGDVVAAYLRAHEKAMGFIKSNTDKAAEIWGKAQDIDPEIAKTAIKNYPVQKFTSSIDPAILKAIADDMLANKQIKDPPAWDKIVDQSFLAPELRTKM